MLTLKEFIDEIEDYTSDCTYEGLHYYVEAVPSTFSDCYKEYVDLVTLGVSSENAIKRIAEITLRFAYE